MGRTSKFLFPVPGRKHNTAKYDTSTPVPSAFQNTHLSKAQRILGTESDLNIDSPIRDTTQDYSWRSQEESISVGMSISISDSTRSTIESREIHEDQSDHWDGESGVFPNDRRLHSRPSSTVLGLDAYDQLSAPRLRHNSSSSTLKSYYDRQNSPLSISQQTSASSTRDLALRKGFPPVVQRNHPLGLEPYVDIYEDEFTEKGPLKDEQSIPEKMRRKPGKLDFSMLFPKSRKQKGDISPVESTTSASSMSTKDSRSTNQPPRKLKKAPSKESMLSSKNGVRSHHIQEPIPQITNSLLNRNTNDTHNQLPNRTVRMDRIPEASLPDRLADRARKDGHGHSRLGLPDGAHEYEKGAFSWKNVRASMIEPPLENSGAASISSRHTKNSRHTVLSQSDLKDKSVLSLSSDSEGDNSDVDTSNNMPSKNYQAPYKAPSRVSLQQSGSSNHHRQILNQSGRLATRTPLQRNGAIAETSHNLLTIPETSSRISRDPGGVVQENQTDNWIPRTHKDHQVSKPRERRNSRHSPSGHSERSYHQPTPPRSPNSLDFPMPPDRPERESRFMAVTQQEEALLEALRQKRRRMREEIIEEHETKKTPSPPRIPQRSPSRYSNASTVDTIRAVDSSYGKPRISLYLDPPFTGSQIIDGAEPSPDLSDFLSFGSDDNSVPINSNWATPSRNGKGNPEHVTPPYTKADKLPPATPPSQARLSAVGGHVAKKRNNGGVRFVDDGQVGSPESMLDEMDGRGIIWGVEGRTLS